MEDEKMIIQTIDQVLTRAKRHGEPIMAILMSQFFDSDLLEVYSEFEQRHHDLYDEDGEEEAYACYLIDKENGFYEEDETFEDVYDAEFSDHYQLQILQSLLTQLRDKCNEANEPFQYKLLLYIVDSVLENYNKVVKSEEHENGDLSA